MSYLFRSLSGGALALALLVAGCGDSAGPSRDAGGNGADGGDGGHHHHHDDLGPLDGSAGDGALSDMGPEDMGLVGDDCEERARWIYVVDSDDNFFRFDPTELAFHPIGTGALSCPNTSGMDGGAASRPFSMAVDEQAIAWVLYNDGQLFRVSTLDATCEATGFVPNQLGFDRFGMGFSSNGVYPNRNGETLFISGGLGAAEPKLGTIDLDTLDVSVVADISGLPELTGNANAQLWGFFPETNSKTIRLLNRTTGAAIASYDLTTATPDTLSTGSRNAWAFAFWGGSYYVFYKSSNDATTNVYRFTPTGTDGSFTFERVITNSGRRIVGAGVSTCAPIIFG